MKTKQKNIMIAGLLGIVLILGVAYAAFQTQLNIQGTSSINSKWETKILSVTPNKTATNSGTAQNPNYTTAGDISHSITNNGSTINFQTALIAPGDSVVYTLVAKNNGTLNAALKTITKTDSSNPAITFTVAGIAENDVIGANDTKTFTVTVAYANVEGQPAAATSNLSLTLDFVQANSSSSGTLSPQGSALAIDPTFVPQYYRYGTSTTYINTASNISAWTQDSSTLVESHNFYLGYDLTNVRNSAGTPTALYACFVIDNTQYCMKGSQDGSTWSQVYNLLNTLQTAGKIACTTFDEDGYFELECPINGTSNTITATHYGFVNVGIGDTISGAGCGALGESNSSMCY